jgi:hypothetical protein
MWTPLDKTVLTRGGAIQNTPVWTRLDALRLFRKQQVTGSNPVVGFPLRSALR